MAFKLQSDAVNDRPIILCDVCSQPIQDIWNSRATGSPVNGQTTALTVRHATCAAAGAVDIALIDFLRLLIIQNRAGDMGSDGKKDWVRVEYPTGKRFQV